ncbi:MAG: DMT family transporter [Desulfobacteraceae bacterium]|jgi:hypothetical protein
MKRGHALILLILTAFFWSSGGLMIKKVELHPMAIAGWRSAIAAFLLLMWTRKPQFNGSLPQIGCALAYAGNMFSFITATKLTTAANAILLQYTAPAYVALFGKWFLKEYPRRIDWLAVGFALAGMVLFFFDHISLAGMWGNLSGVAAGITFAWIILFLRKQKGGSPIESVILGNALTEDHSPQTCPNTAENASKTDISKSFDKIEISSPSISLSPLRSSQVEMLTWQFSQPLLRPSKKSFKPESSVNNQLLQR